MDINVELTIGGTDVPVLAGVQVTEDMKWMPSGSAQVRIPAEYAVDARRGQPATLYFNPYEADNVAAFQLMVRRCATDYTTGTATLTLESADLLLLGTRHIDASPWTSDLYETVYSVIDYVDPGGYHLGFVHPSDDVPTYYKTVGELAEEQNIERPRWERGMPALEYLQALGDLYGCRFYAEPLISGPGGISLRAYTGDSWTTAQRTIPENRLLSLTHETDGGKFFNLALVVNPDTGNEVARLYAPAPFDHEGTAGRRIWYHEAGYADPAKMIRAMSQGETWQITAAADYSIHAGHLVTCDFPTYGVQFTERASVVRHTSDGTTTIDINPPVIGD